MEEIFLEDAVIDPTTSRMRSARSTIWANPPPTQLLSQQFMCKENISVAT